MVILTSLTIPEIQDRFSVKNCIFIFIKKGTWHLERYVCGGQAEGIIFMVVVR